MAINSMRGIRLGILALALALPLGACSNDTVTTAEKRVEAEKQALANEKKEAAASVAQQKEILDKEKDKLLEKAEAKKEKAGEAIEKQLAELEDAKEKLLRDASAKKDALLREFDARKADLDTKLDTLADKTAAEKERIRKEIADGKAALDEELKHRLAQLDADRELLIRRAEQAYEKVKAEKASISDLGSASEAQDVPEIQKTSAP